MKKPFYKLPDFIIRWWCKIFKCSKIESPEQEIEHEADWNKIADRMHENARQDPYNPNITFVEWHPRKPVNKNKLVLDCLVNNFAYGWIKSKDVVRILITEQNWDISKKDIWRIISKLRKKGVLKRYKAMDMNRKICSKYLFDKAVLNDLIRKQIVKEYRQTSLPLFKNIDAIRVSDGSNGWWDTIPNHPEIRTCEMPDALKRKDTCEMPGIGSIRTCEMPDALKRKDTCEMPGNMQNGNNNSFEK